MEGARSQQQEIAPGAEAPVAAPTVSLELASAAICGAPTPAQALALQRSAGNRATVQLLSRSPDSDSKGSREAQFALSHPFVAMQIYGTDQTAEVQFPSTAALAVRFSVNLRNDKQTAISTAGLTENAQREGSEVNAMRHTIWNAINVIKFGVEVATEAANAHEENPNAIDGQDPLTQTFPTWVAADEGCDLRNNIIGREIGAANSKLRFNALAGVVLKVFHEQGLYVVEPAGAAFKAVRRKISDPTFDGATKKLANLNDLGLTPEGVARYQAARDEEWRRALEDARLSD
jgi:hypothetical protein